MMKKKVYKEIFELTVFIIMTGGLLFWLLNPILAGLILAFILFIMITDLRDTIRGFYSLEKLMKEGFKSNKLIPAYFFFEGKRGNHPNYHDFEVTAGNDLYVLFDKEEYLQLYLCPKYDFSNVMEVDENNLPDWLVGDGGMKIWKQDIMAIELYSSIVSEHAIKKRRKNNFWNWYRRKSHPILRHSNSKTIYNDVILTLVLNKESGNSFLSFGIPNEIPYVISFPWGELAPEWYQKMDEFIEISSEVYEYVDNEPIRDTLALRNAKIMASQIKAFVPHAKLLMINKKSKTTRI